MQGDPRVEDFMEPVSIAIKRHVEYPSNAYTDIYNRAYEAIMKAIDRYAPLEDAPTEEQEDG